MSDIKIFMCCHKGFDIIPPLCEPIQCGSAINPKAENVVHDDSGENISFKNREYCELTAHYFTWKNVSADYYGFCHYRRFFCADERGKRPYYIKDKLTLNEQKMLLGTRKYWTEIVERYEIVVPKSENMGISARKHYCSSKYHYTADLDLFVEILNKRYPKLSVAMEKYLSQNKQYFCNMFIMDRDRYFEYCDILFSVLEEFDSRKTPHGNFQSDRTDGYLGEIFTGIYITYCRENGAKIKELPRLDIACDFKKKIGYVLFPPESRRRFWIKSLLKGRKNA